MANSDYSEEGEGGRRLCLQATHASHTTVCQPPPISYLVTGISTGWVRPILVQLAERVSEAASWAGPHFELPPGVLSGR